MPHTSRRKKSLPAKRVEVTDDDGWTRVTTTSLNQRAPTTVAHVPITVSENPWKTLPEPGASVEKIRAAYLKHEQHWLASDSCKALVAILKEQVLADGFHVDKCIIFGSASFCGVWQGWKERHAAALTQVAVVKTIQSTIVAATEQIIPMYAQDPAYNEVDIELLKTLDVGAVHDVEGYNLITNKSLAYTPGAEMFVEMQVLSKEPAVVLTSKLDWYWRNEKGQACTNRVSRGGSHMLATAKESKVSDEPFTRDKSDDTRTNERLEDECQVFETFLRTKQYAGLPRLDYKDDPFHNQYLYWPRVPGDGDDASLDRIVE